MWLQPPFFSMVILHCGQSCVWACNQFIVSLSSSHLICHCFTSAHGAGACASGCLHRVQNAWPLPHVTKPPSPAAAVSTARVHPAWGHQVAVRESSTKLLRRKVLKRRATSPGHRDSTTSSGTRSRHLYWGQLMAMSPSAIFSFRYVAQQPLQNACPHARLLTAALPASSTSWQMRHTLPGAARALIVGADAPLSGAGRPESRHTWGRGTRKVSSRWR